MLLNHSGIGFLLGKFIHLVRSNSQYWANWFYISQLDHLLYDGTESC